MFDFEWINANLFGGAYRRSQGFFDDSDLSSIGRPASARERALLRPFPAPCATDMMEGTGARRSPTARAATATIARARARRTRSGRLCAARRPSASTRMARRSPSRSWSRTARKSAWRSPTRACSRASASTPNVRLVDEVQFQRRRTRFDFDMMIGILVRLALARQRAARTLGFGRRQRRAPTTSPASTRPPSTR